MRHLIFISFLLILILLPLQSCIHAQKDEPVLMQFRTMQPIPGRGTVIIVLEEKEGSRYLPIYIDESQALAIYLGQKGQAPSRPLTHDLLVKILDSLNTTLDRIVITGLREGVYYADLVFSKANQKFKIDSRPSDAIALALRLKAPIYANSQLLEDYKSQKPPKGIVPQMTLAEWGLTVQELDANLAKFFQNTRGLLISDVQENTPAAKSGLQPGDLLTRIENQEVYDLSTFRQAIQTVSGKPVVSVELWRDQKTMRVSIKIPK